MVGEDDWLNDYSKRLFKTVIQNGYSKRLFEAVIRSGYSKRLFEAVIQSGYSKRLFKAVIQSGYSKRLFEAVIQNGYPKRLFKKVKNKEQTMIAVLLNIAVLHIVALVTPGPDFFFVSQVAMSRSKKQAFQGVLGITLGVAVWAGVALLGLHILLERMAWLRSAMMIIGGAYLIYMGYQLLRSALHRRESTSGNFSSTKKGYHNLFLRGLLTNLANPKAIVYFGSIFAVFVANGLSGTMRMSIFILVVIETFFWFSIVAVVFSRPTIRMGYQRLSSWIDGFAGALFGFFGLNILYLALTAP